MRSQNGLSSLRFKFLSQSGSPVEVGRAGTHPIPLPDLPDKCKKYVFHERPKNGAPDSMIGPQNAMVRCLGPWPQFCNMFGSAAIGSGRAGRESEAELPQQQTIFHFAGCFNSTADEEGDGSQDQTLHSKLEGMKNQPPVRGNISYRSPKKSLNISTSKPRTFSWMASFTRAARSHTHHAKVTATSGLL